MAGSANRLTWEDRVRLRDFDVLTFDCYGTLIDWESGLYAALGPLLARANVAGGRVPGANVPGASVPGASVPGANVPGANIPGAGVPASDAPTERDAALAIFAEREASQQAATPDMPYAALLAEVHGQLARAWGMAVSDEENQRFGASVRDWPAFPDTVAALQALKRHFRLVILSNVDRESFRGSNQRLGVTFDAIHTAQDIGSYKPDPRNFRYLLDRLKDDGVAPDRVLHVAQSLFHDHAPANAVGLASAWIDRRAGSPGWGATSAPPAGVSYDLRFDSLGALVAAHRAELAAGADPVR